MSPPQTRPHVRPHVGGMQPLFPYAAVSVNPPPGQLTAIDGALIRKDDNLVRWIVQYRLAKAQPKPLLTLNEYVKSKRGNEAYSEALVMLIAERVYDIDATFVEHAVQNFDMPFAIKTIRSIVHSKLTMTGGQQKILHLAVATGSADLLRYVAAIPIVVEIADSKGQKTEQVARMDFNHPDKMGQTPIFPLIRGEHAETPSVVWEELVRREVNINHIDQYGDTPLLLAIKLRRNDIIQKLLKRSDLKVNLCEDDNPPFHVYCHEGELEMPIFISFLVRIRIEFRTNKLRNYCGRSWYHCLLHNRGYHSRKLELLPFIEKLLEFEVDVDMRDNVNRTPLITASQLRYPPAILNKLVTPRIHKNGKVVEPLQKIAAMNFRHVQSVYNECDK